MKYTVLAGLLMAGAAAKDGNVEDTKKYVQIVEGFLRGALDAEGFTDIEHCLTDGEHILQDAEAAYQDFSKKTAAGTIAGIKDISDALKYIQSAMKDCSSLKADWEKLAKIVREFSNPTSFIYHVGKDIIHNGVQIYSEVHTAVDDYKQGNWNDFGFQCGEAAAKTFLGAEAQKNLRMEKLAKVQQGFLKAYGLNFDLEALLFCIYDEDQALIFLDVAYEALQEAIHAKTTSDRIGDLVGTAIGVFGAYQQFEQGLPACEQVFSKADFTPVEKSMNIMNNPLKNLALMTENLKKYEGKFEYDIESAVFHYQMEDYEKFGEFLGNFAKLATTEEPLEATPTTWADVYPKDNRDAITEMAQGFFEATNVGEFNFTNLLICIYEMDQAAIAAYEGVEILEEAWSKKDWQEAIGGVIAFVAAYQGVEQGLPVCEAVDESQYNWTEFENLVKLTQNPEKTVKVIDENLIFNGVTITADFLEAMTAYENSSYKDFGFNLGKMLMAATKTEEPLFLY